jgi:hypothetical protein
LLSDEPLWDEIGHFDERGHVLGADLATQAGDLLQEVAEIVRRLARPGRKVRIVTDHGWLLIPGGLDQAPLVAGLTVAGGKGHRVATSASDPAWEGSPMIGRAGQMPRPN